MTNTKPLIIPSFKSEDEEANWLDRHKRLLEAEMMRAVKEGRTLTRKQFLARVKSRPVTIRLATRDIDTARELAAEKGIGYQTYIKLLLHEALQKELRANHRNER